MDYSELAETYDNLENTSSRLKKTGIVSDLLKKTESQLLPKLTLLLEGTVFPAWSDKEIGIASKSMAKILSSATGFSSKQVSDMFKKSGDYGLVAESAVEKKKQNTLFKKSLKVTDVFETLQKLASVEGKGSQERKFRLVTELISSAKPKEAKYIVRTVLGDLRIGVAQGILRDAIAKAFFSDKDPKEAVKAVEWAWFIRPDYGEIAAVAKDKGIAGLEKISLEPGKPYNVLLAERSPGLEEALKKFDKPALEFKYDGARVMIHKKDSEVWLFTRRLENITKQFPDLVELARKCIKPGSCIVEGEVLAKNKKTGKPMPFQRLSQRIKRKYDIEKMLKEIPIEVNLFDIVYLNGKELFEESLKSRREKLEKAIKPAKHKFQLAKQLVTGDLQEAEKFYKEALDASQEGLIVKNLDAKYHPGRRVGYWLKVKPVMENLDLVITGAKWGTGKRAGWLGSFILSCKDGDNYRECGMLGTGIKEKSVKRGDITFKKLSDMLKPHITERKSGGVDIKPKIIIEVSYEEIQKSPNYSSGFALRFPRFVSLREDKSLSEVDPIDKLKRLYDMQKGGR